MPSFMETTRPLGQVNIRDRKLEPMKFSQRAIETESFKGIITTISDTASSSYACFDCY